MPDNNLTTQIPNQNSVNLNQETTLNNTQNLQTGIQQTNQEQQVQNEQQVSQNNQEQPNIQNNNSRINQNISNPTQVTNPVNSISNAATTSGNNEATVVSDLDYIIESVSKIKNKLHSYTYQAKNQKLSFGKDINIYTNLNNNINRYYEISNLLNQKIEDEMDALVKAGEEMKRLDEELKSKAGEL